ncbi:MAG: hypothetical protein HXY45_17235 [Syntrophaceae bacterium]|nr:hypothetical protein [Syntrophaceae bacterium]
MSNDDPIAFQKRGIQCRRCNGLMGLEKFYGPNDTFFGWHCLHCGDILDPVILLNRLRPRPRQSTSEKREELISMFQKWMEAWPEPV